MLINALFTKCVFDLFKTLKLQTLDDEIKSFENKLQQDAAGKLIERLRLRKINIGRPSAFKKNTGQVQ